MCRLFDLFPSLWVDSPCLCQRPYDHLQLTSDEPISGISSWVDARQYLHFQETCYDRTAEAKSPSSSSGCRAISVPPTSEHISPGYPSQTCRFRLMLLRLSGLRLGYWNQQNTYHFPHHLQIRPETNRIFPFHTHRRTDTGIGSWTWLHDFIANRYIMS